MGDARHVLVWSSDRAMAPRVVAALGPLSTGGTVKIECCDGGEEAMEGVLEDRVHVLVADLQETSARAATMLRNIKRVRPRLPLIILSSVFDDRFRSQVLPLGIHCHLLREFEQEELIEAVRSALRLASTKQPT